MQRNDYHVPALEQKMFRDRTEPTLFRAGTVPDTRESIPGPSFLFPRIREFDKTFLGIQGIKSTTHTNISVNVFSMYFNKSAWQILFRFDL